MKPQHNATTKRLCNRAILGLVCASISLTQPTVALAQEDGSKAFIIPALAALFKTAMTSTGSTLFSRFFSRIINKPDCTTASADGKVVASTCDPKNSFSENLQSPGSLSRLSPEQARERLAQAPGFTLKLDRLVNDQPNAAVLDSIAFTRTPDAKDMAYQIRTGEIFAIKFQTTVPGRVRILNEAGGSTDQIGYYEVIPEIDNRIPRERGMRLDPPHGTEYLHIEFTPCISSVLISDPRAAAFANYLPTCGLESTNKQFNSGKYVPPAGSKAITNLDSPDATQPVLAGRDVQPGQTLTMKIVVDHQPAKP